MIPGQPLSSLLKDSPEVIRQYATYHDEAIINTEHKLFTTKLYL